MSELAAEISRRLRRLQPAADDRILLTMQRVHVKVRLALDYPKHPLSQKLLEEALELLKGLEKP